MSHTDTYMDDDYELFQTAIITKGKQFFTRQITET